MKNLDKRIFRKDYKYRSAFINVCLLRIKFGHRSDRTIRGYKMYVFKMMHDIVHKNIYNYLKLLKNGTNIIEPPSYNDILTDVYIMFDKCVDKYRVRKNSKFYFYFNKSLSRNLFREYQKMVKRNEAELTDPIMITHPHLRHQAHGYGFDIVIDRLCFNKTERRIIESRLKGERICDFLAKNKDITNNYYAIVIKRIKEKLLIYQKQNRL